MKYLIAYIIGCITFVIIHIAFFIWDFKPCKLTWKEMWETMKRMYHSMDDEDCSTGFYL